MEFIGQIKYIDKVGRVVIPGDIRKFFKIKEETPVEICITTEGILIRPWNFDIEIKIKDDYR